jgi:hypothetical protein
LAAAGLTIFAVAGTASAGTTSYPNTPGEQTFTPQGSECYNSYTVPAGVTEIGVTAVGDNGGDGVNNVFDGLNGPADLAAQIAANNEAGNVDTPQPGGQGGLGSQVNTIIDVTPGETLYVGPASYAFPGGAPGLAGMYTQPNTLQAEEQEPGAGGAGGNASFVATQAPASTSGGNCSFDAAQLATPGVILVVAAGGGGGGGAGSGQDTNFTNGLIAQDPGGDGGSESQQTPAQIGGGSLWQSISTVDDTFNTTGDQDEGTGGGSAGFEGGGIDGVGGDSVSTIPDWGVQHKLVAALVCIAGSNGGTGVQTTGGGGGAAAQSDGTVPNTNFPSPTDANQEPNIGAFSDAASPDSGATDELGDPGEAASELIDYLSGDSAAPQVYVDGCGGEDTESSSQWTDIPSEIQPGLSSGGGGGGGGGYYGGGGGGGADDFYINAGGGGGGAGASYIAGVSTQAITNATSVPSSNAEVELTPIETPPTINNPVQSDCNVNSGGCAAPTVTCAIGAQCSLQLDSTGYVPPQFGYAGQSSPQLPSGLAFVQANSDGTQDGFSSTAYIQGTPTVCSDAGTHTYTNAIEAINPVGTATLPLMTINVSPGTLQDVQTSVDPGGASLTNLTVGGQDLDLSASAQYSSNCNYDVTTSSGGTWSVTGSENPQGQPTANNSDVATVAAGPGGTEEVVPQGPGSANVTFSYTDAWNQTVSTYTQVVVQYGEPLSMSVTGGTLDLVPGQSATPTIIANFGNNVTENVTDLVQWEGIPSNLSTAGVSVSGDRIQAGTPLDVGNEASQSGNVTAYLGSVQAQVPVTVSFGNPTSISVTAFPAIGGSLPAGTSNEQLTATADYGYGVQANVTDLATWTSSDTDRAEVGTGTSDGQLMIPNYTLGGPVTLTAKLGSATGTYLAQVALGTPNSISVSDGPDGTGNVGSDTLALGSSEPLYATGTVDSETDDVTNQTTWTSSNTSAVTVTNQGIITAVGPDYGGPVQIIANDGGVTNAFEVTIGLSSPSMITVTPANPTVPLGAQVQLTATGTYIGNRTANITSLVTWSAPAGLGTISDSGLLNTKGTNSQGLSDPVTASLGGQQGSSTITEQGQAPNGITVTGGSATLGLGESEQLTATANFDDDSTSNVTSEVTWTSQNPALFTVSSSGVVQATGNNPGGSGLQANIYATLTYTNSSDQTETIPGAYFMTVSLANPTSITVNPPPTSTTAVAPAVDYTGSLYYPSGYQFQFTATGNYPNGVSVDLTGVAGWTSSDTADTSVSDGGVTVNDQPTATTSTKITASYSGASASLTVPVSGPLTLNGPSGGTANESGTVGDTYTYTFSVAGGSGDYNWTILNPYNSDQPTTNPDVQLSSTTGNSVTVTYTPSASDYGVADPPNTNAEPYSFVVEATDGATNGSQTQEVSVNLTRPSQTLGWVQTLPATGAYGSSIFLSGSSSANLQTTISTVVNGSGYDGCTVSGGDQIEFNVDYDGVCEIELSQAGNNSYAPASITATINVSVAPGLFWYNAQAESQEVGGTAGSFDAQPSQSGPQDPGAITYSIDPATTNNACSFTVGNGNYASLSYNSIGTCVLDAHIAAATDSYGFTYPAQTIQQSVGVIGDQSYLQFNSSAPGSTTVGQTYKPTFTTSIDYGNDPLYPMVSPANPVVTIDTSNSSPANACTTDGTTVTFAHIGTCVINADQPATSQFEQINALTEQTVTVDAATQAVTFPPLAKNSYIPGDSVTLNPTGGASGEPVALSVDGSSSSTDPDDVNDVPCSLVGNTVTFEYAGTCVIDANQAGDGDYGAASQVQETFTVQNAQVALLSASLTCTDQACDSYARAPLSGTAATGANVPVVVTLENAAGAAARTSTATTVDLSAADQSAQLEDGSGNPISSVVIPADSTSATVYYGNTVSGTDELFASAVLPNQAQTPISSPQTPVMITAGPVKTLKFVDGYGPSDTGAGSPMSPVLVEAFDAFGNPVLGAPITMTANNASSNASVPIVADSTETTSLSGGLGNQAEFDSLQINALGTDTLTATSNGATVTSPSFTISAGPVNSLEFTTQPTTTTSGKTMPEIDVEALDSVNDPIAGKAVTLSVTAGTITGDTTETTGLDGIAAFKDVQVSPAGNYTLTATYESVQGTSNTFTINPPATNLANVYLSPSGSDGNDCDSSGTPCATLSGALAEAGSGAAIHISGTVDASGISLSEPVTIEGVPGTDATIDGQQSGTPIFTVTTGGVNFSGLTIENGSTGSVGGAIDDQSSGTVTVTDSTFTGNYAGYGGGAISATGGGTFEVSGSEFDNNTVNNNGNGGGAIDNGDPAIGASNPAETLVIEDSTFTANQAYTGGAILSTYGGNEVTILGSTFSADIGNASYGPEIWNAAGTATYAGDLFNGVCKGTVSDLGYNASSDGSCYGSPVPSTDATASTAVGNLTAGIDGLLAPTTGNPAIDRIPSGTAVTTPAGKVTLCSATVPSALFVPGTSGTCNAGASQQPKPPPAAVTALTITAPTSVVYGHAVTVSGVLTSGGHALAGKTVTLYYRKVGVTPYTKFPATATSGVTGAVSFTTFKPTTPVQVLLVYAGTSAYAESNSAVKSIAEQLALTISESGKAATGKSLTFTGAVSPNEKGATVCLQRKSGSSWTNVASGKLSSVSKYSLALKLKSKGKFTYRVLVNAVGGFSQSLSSTKSISVS